MPADQISLWRRGNWLFVRFPHSHTVKLPCERTDVLLRILRQREIARMRAGDTATARELPSLDLTQWHVDQWLKAGNAVAKDHGHANAVTGKYKPETPQERRNRVYQSILNMMSEY